MFFREWIVEGFWQGFDAIQDGQKPSFKSKVCYWIVYKLNMEV